MGKTLSVTTIFRVNCAVCHGEGMAGDGKMGLPYSGIAVLHPALLAEQRQGSIPRTQCGDQPGRATDMATHLVAAQQMVRRIR